MPTAFAAPELPTCPTCGNNVSLTRLEVETLIVALANMAVDTGRSLRELRAIGDTPRAERRSVQLMDMQALLEKLDKAK